MGKNTADGLRKITVQFLKKHDYFSGFRTGTLTWTHGDTVNSIGADVCTMNGEMYMRLHYQQTSWDTEEKKDFDYKIPLTTTPCYLGGLRYWFICPLYKNGRYCGRRVGTLYKGGDYYGCRHCYELSYDARNENNRGSFKAFKRFFDLEEKIERAEMRLKKETYKGKPTRQARRLERLCEEINTFASIPNVIDDLLGRK